MRRGPATSRIRHRTGAHPTNLPPVFSVPLIEIVSFIFIDTIIGAVRTGKLYSRTCPRVQRLESGLARRLAFCILPQPSSTEGKRYEFRAAFACDHRGPSHAPVGRFRATLPKIPIPRRNRLGPLEEWLEAALKSPNTSMLSPTVPAWTTNT